MNNPNPNKFSRDPLDLDDISSDNFHSLDESEFLPSISPWLSGGGLLLVFVFGTAAILASVLKFNLTVQAPATIRPAGELRLVQAPVGSTVEKIEIEEFQKVKKHDVIARLDDSRLQTRVSQLEGEVYQGNMQLAQLDAQVSALKGQVAAEVALTQRAISAAKANLTEAEHHYHERQAINRSELQEAQASLDLTQEQLSRYQQLQDSGAIALLQVREKEAEFQVATARLQRMQSILEPTKASIVRAQEQIAQEQARGSATLASLQQQQEQLLQGRIQLANQIEQSRRELAQVETELDGTVIRAPIDGIVLQLQLRNPGQVMQAGQSIALIAPGQAPMVVRARVRAQDINKVEPGQKVQMRVSACPYPDYGTLDGIVTNVAPDATPAASGEPVTSSIYEVSIKPENLYVGTTDRQCQLQLGMEGRADIISRRETVLQFILRKSRLITNI